MESVATRYALALVKLAEENTSVDRLHVQLNALQSMLTTQPDWYAFLKNPFYTKAQKETFIQSIFPVETWGTLMSFLRLLLKNHRLIALPDILIEAIHLCETRLNLKHGRLVVASSLTEQQQKTIESALANHLGITLHLTQHIDPTLLGGFRVDIDGKVYDASVLGKLEALTRHLKQRGSL